MYHNLAFNQKRFYTYLNYCLAFIFSLIFLIYAKKLGLINLNKYILVISLSAIFASVIYSTSIKSEYNKGLILIGITNKSLYLLFFFSLIVAIYLGYKNTFLVIFLYLNIFYEICFNLILIYFLVRSSDRNPTDSSDLSFPSSSSLYSRHLKEMFGNMSFDPSASHSAYLLVRR